MYSSNKACSKSLRSGRKALFHGFPDLVYFAFLDQFGDVLGIEHDLDAATSVPSLALTRRCEMMARRLIDKSDSSEVRRRRGKKIDDPVQRVVAVVRMQRGNAQVAGLRVEQRVLQRLAIADSPIIIRSGASRIALTSAFS